MDEEFWQSRWRENRTGFHEGRPNEKLLRHFHLLDLGEGDTVFVPLCGKAVDLDWLVSQKFRVIGIEFHQQAVAEVFARQNLVPEVVQDGPHHRYQADNIVIYVGDFFELEKDNLGGIDAVYDRAALVALPPDMRLKYAAHVSYLTDSAPQLLLTLGCDAQRLKGPPFFVSSDEIRKIYGGFYNIKALTNHDVSGFHSDPDQNSDDTWLLKPDQVSKAD